MKTNTALLVIDMQNDFLLPGRPLCVDGAMPTVPQIKKLLDYVGFKDEDELYIIGDVLGRGEEPIPLLRYVMQHPNMKLLMGNHEQAFLWNMPDRPFEI